MRDPRDTCWPCVNPRVWFKIEWLTSSFHNSGLLTAQLKARWTSTMCSIPQCIKQQYFFPWPLMCKTTTNRMTNHYIRVSSLQSDLLIFTRGWCNNHGSPGGREFPCDFSNRKQVLLKPAYNVRPNKLPQMDRIPPNLRWITCVQLTIVFYLLASIVLAQSKPQWSTQGHYIRVKPFLTKVK